MGELRVSGEIEAPVEALWKALADFGEVGWMKGVSRVEVTGEGPGMVRNIYAGGDEAVREVLESVDAKARRIGYTITQNNPMPVDEYHASCTAVDLGRGRSRLDWACRFTPRKGVDEATAKATIEGMYGVLISWVKESLEKA